MVPPPPSPIAPTPPLLAALLFPVGRVFSLSVKILEGEGPSQCLLTLGSRETAAVRGTGTAHASTSDQPRAADYPPDLSPVRVPKAGRSEFPIAANNQFLGTTSLKICRSPAGSWKEAA